jgi:predicted ATPase
MSRAGSLAFVVTGTWGVGKTTLLERLAGEFHIMPEPGRRAMAEDPTLQDNWQRFAEVLLARAVTDYANATSRPGVTLFDRGVPDCLAYARWFELDESPFRAAGHQYRYCDEVLICPPWREIYINDDLRLATYDQAVAFNEVLTATYRDLDYRLVTLPTSGVEDRAGFVRNLIAAPAEDIDGL